MALFFDSAWFDARLAERELDRAALAAVAGWSAEELALVVKDQREIAPREVQAIAALLNAPPEEVAARCGVSTRAHPKDDVAARLDAIEARLTRLEAQFRVRNN
jgi:hypothetical protein